jgi:hypothetical protein
MENGKLAPGFDADGGNIATTILGFIKKAFRERLVDAATNGIIDFETAEIAATMFDKNQPMFMIRDMVRDRGYVIDNNGAIKVKV